MQLHLGGTNTINAPMEKVYSLLTDPNFLAKTLPDAEESHVVDVNTLEARLKLRLAVVTSKMAVKLTIGDRTPPTKATLLAEGTGSGSTMKISSVFELREGPPTSMTWSADAEISGVMAGMGSTLLRGFATKKVAEIFDGITKSIEEAASAP